MECPAGLVGIRRVLAFVAQGAGHREAAARFGVSAASVGRWRARGEAHPCPLGNDRRSGRIETQGGLIRDLPDATPDITIEELRHALGAQGHRYGCGTIQRFFRRHRITRKKRLATRASRTARTS